MSRRAKTGPVVSNKLVKLTVYVDGCPIISDALYYQRKTTFAGLFTGTYQELRVIRMLINAKGGLS